MQSVGDSLRAKGPRSGVSVPVQADRSPPPVSCKSGYQASFPRVMLQGCGVDHSLQFRTEAKERYSEYLNSPSELSWLDIERSLTLPIGIRCIRTLGTILWGAVGEGQEWRCRTTQKASTHFSNSSVLGTVFPDK